MKWMTATKNEKESFQLAKYSNFSSVTSKEKKRFFVRETFSRKHAYTEKKIMRT